MTTISEATAGISALLRPESIVVLGASATRMASGNEALANLRRSSYSGNLMVVHPAAPVIDGVAAFPSVEELPATPDVALVSLPARAVMAQLQALEVRGCRAALLPGAAFDRQQTAELEAFVKRSRMVVHGPNCMGLLSVADDTPLWFYDGMLTDLEPGPLALVSQSGSATFLAKAVEGVGFSRVISSGNEVGLTTADYLEWLAHDDATSAVGAVLESIRDVPRFIEAVRRLRQAGKPLAVLKVGRTEAAMAASVAHTGALVGSHEAYDSLFEMLDIPLVRDYDEMAAVLTCLGTPGLPSASGVGVGVVTDSGGEAVLAADLAVGRGVTMSPLERCTLDRLSEVLPGVSIQNPVDAGGSPLAGEDCYPNVLEIVARDSTVHSLMLIVESLASLNSSELGYSAPMFDALRATAEAGHDKPILVASPTSASTHADIRRRLGSSIPVIRGLGNALVAAGALARNQRPVPPRPTRPRGLPEADWVAEMRTALWALPPGPLPQSMVHTITSAYGLQWVGSTVVTDADEAVAWAEDRYPVVVKVASTSITHRSDVGGVVLDVKSPTELREAVVAIRSRLASIGHDVQGYEIQEFVTGSREALIGFVTDPVFGPVVTAGGGGVLVELRRDTRVSLAPLGASAAVRLLAETELGKVLSGYRNLVPTTDLTDAAEAVAAVSWIACDFQDVLVECDLNPVLITSPAGRVRLVDALLVVGDNRSSREAE